MKKFNYKNQQGIVLFISLAMLFVVTLIGVSSLRSNLMGEQMTRNTLQRQAAFEAAEIALLAGEQDVEAIGTQIASRMYAGFKGGVTAQRNAAESCQMSIGRGGICSPVEFDQNFDPDDPQYNHWVMIRDGGNRNKLNVWNTASRHREVTPSVRNRLNLAEDPKYIIEFMGFVPEPGTPSDCAGTPGAGGVPTSLELDSTESLWPYCQTDNMQFRVTALGTAGNEGEARVMLQSIYVIQ